MRILIVTSFFPPLNSIASHRPYSWAKHWSAAGHDVTVLTTQKLPDPATDLDMRTEGFDVIETAPIALLQYLKKSYKPDNAPKSDTPTTTSALRRGIDWLRRTTGTFDSCHMPDVTDFWVSGAFNAIKDREPWDVVISTAPPFPVHRLAYYIRRRGLARRWVMDYRDLIVDNPNTKAIFPFRQLERRLEMRYINQADAITTVSQGLAKSLTSRYPKAPIHIIENGFEPEDLSKIPPDPFFVDDDKFRIVYLGTIYKDKQDPRPLFHAIRELADDGHHQLLKGLEVLFYGPRLGDVQQMIEHYRVSPWVKLGGFVKRSEALQIQRDAHALLFLPWTDPGVDGILSGKIFEYLSSGTEIISIGALHLEAAQRLLIESKTSRMLGCDIALIKNYLIENLPAPKKAKKDADPNVLGRYTRPALADKLFSIIAS